MSADAASNEVEQVPDVHHPAGVGLIKPGYDPALTNEDLAPLKKQTWSSYNIFAFWMSDVHSVGGYLTAGSLFALGIAAWQVLIALLVGIVIVQIFVNLVAKPSQKTGVPYPVINRAIFGVKGANIPAIIRGLIAVAWYGVQTYLAAESLNIIFLKFIPASASLLQVSFLGLTALGWISFAILWFAQAALFWTGMETIRKFIDWAGPAVYVVMVVLAIYLVSQAGWSNISFSLHTGEDLGFWASIPIMLTAIAIVVSYFSGPMLNFGDFSRYGRSFEAVRKGNLWGLPFNFLFSITFSLAMNDYGFELLSDQPIPVDDTNVYELFSPENLFDDIQRSVNSVEMARRKFRDIAVIGGLIFQGFPVEKKKQGICNHLPPCFSMCFQSMNPAIYCCDKLITK